MLFCMMDLNGCKLGLWRRSPLGTCVGQPLQLEEVLRPIPIWGGREGKNEG